jgi:peptidyl-prolyl cis-trans isomerase SurA
MSYKTMSYKQYFLSLVAAVGVAYIVPAIAQPSDPVLFTVGTKEVRVSEFKYIYDKNNGAKADYSEKSLREYLQLYTDFKLQLLKGEELKINEDAGIKNEQAQYRMQLANNYLTDREVTEKLVKEAYERSREDRRVSHIFVNLRQGASEKEEQDAYNRLKKLRDMTTAANFAENAKAQSEDGYSKNNGGDLGFFTVLQMPYAFETAAYTTKKGEISQIVRTPYGYHFLMVTEVRPALGKMQIAHLLIRGGEAESKTRIDSLYTAIQAGGNFEQLVQTYSQDNMSKGRAGLLGWKGINEYPADFEAAIFSLKRDGEIGSPVKSEAGWHIIKRVKGQVNPTYNEIKGELTDLIKKDPRFGVVQEALVARIKSESNYKLDAAIYEELQQKMTGDNLFFNTQWNVPAAFSGDTRVLFTIGSKSMQVKDFFMQLQRLANERINMQPRTVAGVFERVLNATVAEQALAYEETQLEKKYPDFKALLREYEEGILLFEVKKRLIWEKASADDAGIKAYYEANQSKYKFKEYAVTSLYILNTIDKKEVKAILKMAKKSSADDVKATFNANKAVVASTSANYEKGKTSPVSKIKWKAGAVSKPEAQDNKTTFAKIESIVPEKAKSLDEARGFIVADYQDQLEKELLKSLREQYPAKVDEEVFKSLMKK